MEADGFSWWVKRIKRALDLYDEFRIDHFRGLAGFWAVPSGKLNTSEQHVLQIKYLYCQ
jgi:4-alpha-glucanotransferase